MNTEELKNKWLNEEKIAHIRGWDFSHIEGKYEEVNDLPWDYRTIVKGYLTDEMKLLDYDTGGGEFLLSLGHPHNMTYATEGYEPNVKLCEETLLPLGIGFKPCSDPGNIPFEDESFDLIINRHGSFVPRELYRLLKKGGIFITQQVGEDNDRDLVEAVLPGTEKNFSDLYLADQKAEFQKAGFTILSEGESYRPIRFFDIGALVWFARIIEWEFTDFSVEKCFDRLLELQKTVEKQGYVEGTTHRYMIVAQK